MDEETESIEVKYGGARALVKQRGNGWWSIRWRVAGKPGMTTRVSKSDAMDFARLKVRELSAGQGGRLLTIEDAKLVEQLKRVSGSRSPFGLLDQLEDASKRWGADSIGRALRHYEHSGLAMVLQVTITVAKDQFLERYEKKKRDVETISTLRKELNAFCRIHLLLVCDLSNSLLEDWVMRKREGGEDVEKRTFNNRLNVWRTFLNWCREQNYWPKGEKHPGELVGRERLDDTVPVIWTPETGIKALKAVLEFKPKLLNYLICGCWIGMRPEEARRIAPEAWNWKRGYVELLAGVAAKVGQQRYTPIPDNVRQLLGGVIVDPRDKKKTRGRWEPVCCGTEDIIHLSKLLKEEKVIEEWVPDVMRHSYISYRIAQGHGMGQVADWAGNSESEIRKKYRAPMMKEEGAAWFGIGLSTAA